MVFIYLTHLEGLDIPKGIGAGAHQSGRLWALKNEVLSFRKVVCMHGQGMCMHASLKPLN